MRTGACPVLRKSVSLTQVMKSATRTSASVCPRDAAVDIEEVAGALSRPRGGGEVQDRLGDVLGQDVDLEGVAPAIVLLELVRLDAVGRRALLAPRRVRPPDARAGEDRVGVDGVDADARVAALLGQAAGEVQLGG